MEIALLVASLFLVAMPGAPSSVLAPSSDALFLVPVQATSKQFSGKAWRLAYEGVYRSFIDVYILCGVCLEIRKYFSAFVAKGWDNIYSACK